MSLPQMTQTLLLAFSKITIGASIVFVVYFCSSDYLRVLVDDGLIAYPFLIFMDTCNRLGMFNADGAERLMLERLMLAERRNTAAQTAPQHGQPHPQPNNTSDNNKKEAKAFLAPTMNPVPAPLRRHTPKNQMMERIVALLLFFV